MANTNSNRYRQALEALFMHYFGGTARKVKKLSSSQMEDRITRRMEALSRRQATA